MIDSKEPLKGMKPLILKLDGRRQGFGCGFALISVGGSGSGSRGAKMTHKNSKK